MDHLISVRSGQINPRPSYLLCEPIFPENVGSLIIPGRTETVGRYSSTAVVHQIGPLNSEIEIGDLVILEDEGFETETANIDVFLLIAKPVSNPIHIYISSEYESELHVLLGEFKRNKKDQKIRVRDEIQGNWASMNLSDILEITKAPITENALRAEYLPTIFLELADGFFYLVHEKKILATLKETK